MPIIYLTLLAALYLVPSFVGYNKRNASAIVALNLLLGWTVIGWVVALVWALTNDTPQPNVIIRNEPQVKKESKLDLLDKINNLRKEGVLTDQEFNDQKRKILDGQY